MSSPDEDLGRRPADALRVRHWMTRPVEQARPEEPARDVRLWMDALGYDVVPLAGAPSPHMLRRSDLAHVEGPVGPAARPVPPSHRLDADLPLAQALPHLAAHGWFFARSEARVVGVVTRADLARPVVGLHSLANLLALEDGLAHLLRTYGGSRDTGGPRGLAENLDDTLRTPRLCADLDLSPTDDADSLRALLALRRHLLEGQSLADPSLPEAVDVAILACRLAQTIDALVDDRPQVWDAYVDALLLDPDTDEPWPAPHAGVMHVLTGHNPQERWLKQEDNDRRNKALGVLLRAAGAHVQPTLTRAPDGSWPEPGFAATGLTREAALALVRRFQQRAMYELTPHELRVIDPHGAIRRTRPLP